MRWTELEVLAAIFVVCGLIVLQGSETRFSLLLNVLGLTGLLYLFVRAIFRRHIRD